MKYEVPIHRLESKSITIEAESPHEAIIGVLKEFGDDWRADGVDQIAPDPDGRPGDVMTVESYEIVSGCEGCGKPILTGDKYYQWGGEDPVDTCLECGGAEPGHVPATA